MAQLPDVSALGGRPVPQNRLGIVQQDTTAEGAGIAQFGQVLGRIGEEFQQRDDEQKVLEYRRKLSEFEAQKIHDPQNGAVSKLGKDAFGLSQDLPSAFDEFASKSMEGLTSNRQRMLAQQMAQGRRESVTVWAASHEMRQRDAFDETEYVANKATFKNNAILSPEKAPAEIAALNALTEQRLARKGMGADVVKAQIAADSSSIHSAVVLKLADSENTDDIDKAKAYYFTNKKQILGEDQQRIERALDHGSLIVEAQTAVDEITLKFTDPKAAAAHIHATYGGKKEQAVMAEWDKRQARQTASDTAAVQQSYGTAQLHVERGQHVPASVWDKMDDAHRASILRMQTARLEAFKAQAEGKPVKTVFAVWYKLNQMAGADPQGFAKAPLPEFVDRISTSDLERFAQIQNDIKQGKGVHDLISVNTQIANATERLTLKGKDNEKERGALGYAIQQEIIAARERGEVMDDKGRQRIIDRQIMDWRVKKPWRMDSVKKAYQLTDEDRLKEIEPVIPDSDFEALKARRKADGLPVDDASIMAHYRKLKGL